MPEILLEFSNKNLDAYLEGDIQRTQSITLNGDSEYYLTIKLQNGVTLVNETKNTTETGNVNIYGGDTFYLKAPLTVNGSWTSDNIDNCKYIFQPIIYRTKISTYQDLAGKLQVQVDPGTTTNINVNWLSTGNIIIHKVDADNASIVIPNTVFEIYDSNNNLIDTVTTDLQGCAKVNNIPIGKYKIVEKSTDKYYNINVNDTVVDLSVSNKEVIITNEKKKGYIEINKYDADDVSKKIANVKFGIYDTNNKLIETLITNVNGYVKSSALDIDKRIYCKRIGNSQQLCSK